MRAFQVESLERRTLLALTVQIDYSLDNADFFANADRRAVLQAAVNEVVSNLGDTLSAIVPSGSNSYSFTIFNPQNDDDDVTFNNVVIPQDTLIVYVGAQNIQALGVAGPAQVSASGSAAWIDLVKSRGQGNVDGPNANDFGPIGGSIAFDTAPPGGWYFGLDPGGIREDQNDFFSVAMHEMFHVLGFGTSPAWEERIVGAGFNGPVSREQHDGSGNVPLSDDEGHWAPDTEDEGQEVLMDPDITSGERKNATALDIAGLRDIGWEVPIRAAVTTGDTFPPAGTATVNFNVTYTGVGISTTTLGSDDLIVSGPGGFTVAPTVLNVGPTGRSRTVTYTFTAPGGTFDGADSGAYTVSLNPGAVADVFGETAPGGAIGGFNVLVNTGPAASLASADNITRVGGASHAVVVNYVDSSGIDPITLGTDDVTVVRTSDNSPLTVASTSVASDGAGTTTVTYTVNAPGGTWDVSDNGTYAITLGAQQVRDGQTIAADAATLGSFDVSITARAFSTGAPLSFVDATADGVVISMAGPGGGQAFFTGPGNADLAEIILNNTAVSTALTIVANGNGTSLPAVTINGPLKSFTGKGADLAGLMSIDGPAPKIQLRNATGTIGIGGSDATPASFSIAEATNLSVNSLSPIKSFKVNNWLDTDDTPDQLLAPSVAALAVKGAMSADVIAGTIGKITFGGALSDATLRAGAGGIASLVASSIARSRIFGGVRADLTTLPSSPDDFANPAAEIKTFTVKSRTAGSFADSLLAAAKLGKVNLGGVAPSNGGTVFGVAALTAKSLTTATGPAGPLKRSKLNDPAASLTAGDFVLRLL